MDEKAETGPVGRQAMGVRMRVLRRKAGLRQEDLAGRLGVTKRTIGSWERNGPPTGKVAEVDVALGGGLAAPGADAVGAALSPVADLLDSLRLRIEALEQRLAR